MQLHIRPATRGDSLPLLDMVLRERLNPNGIHWSNFLLAFDASGLAGAVQLRPHPGGLRELGSLVVRPDLRGRGVAARLIDALMTRSAGRVLMVTGAAHAAHYARWGFQPIAPWRAPASILRNYVLGQLFGSAHALLSLRRPRRLAVLELTSSATPVPS